MLVFTFYVTCIFSGMIEVGALLWGIGAGYSVEAAIGLAIAYQIGNILLFFLNRKLRRIQYVFAIIACICAGGVILLQNTVLRYWSAFACFALLSTIIQTLRSAVKSKEPRWRKRVFRVLGFLISAVMYQYGAYALAIIAVLTLILTVCSPKYEDDCWLTKLINGQYGKNRICLAMTVHQMHYFVYCYCMLLIALFAYKSPLAASFWFVANWIPYILTEPLVKLTKTKAWLYFLIGGHILVAGLLIGMYITVEQYSIIAMILWAFTGFGGGNVFCIKNSLLKYKEYHSQVWVFSENVGHFLGVVIALVVYHLTQSLSPMMLLGSFFALSTIGLILGTIARAKKNLAHSF